MILYFQDNELLLGCSCGATANECRNHIRIRMESGKLLLDSWGANNGEMFIDRESALGLMSFLEKYVHTQVDDGS